MFELTQGVFNNNPASGKLLVQQFLLVSEGVMLGFLEGGNHAMLR